MTLYTVSAGGFNATGDAFALDQYEGLWFLSMLGSQTALKAIWAAILKQPPEPAWLIQGLEGAFRGDYRRFQVAYETVGTRTTQLARLPGSGGYHALVFTRLAEYTFDRPDFLLLARSEKEATMLHYTFLDRRVAVPLHPSWAGWLWERGARTGEVEALESVGILAYRCRHGEEPLRLDISRAVASRELSVPPEGNPQNDGHRSGEFAGLVKGGSR